MTQDAYVFPGQGSQCVGMGHEFFRAFARAHDTFLEADDILGYALSKLCFDGPADTLTATQNAQPAILVTSVAVLRVLRAERADLPSPGCVAGHSLGEYSALVAAGALDFGDAVRLTRMRGELMARAGSSRPGSMAAVLRLPDEQVRTICEQAAQQSGAIVQVANYNSPGQVVISGEPAGVATATELVKAAGGRVTPLAVSVAAHSALMTSAAQDLATEVGATDFAVPSTPVIGNVKASPLASPAEIREELVAQLTSPVLWTTSILRMAKSSIERVVEIGPGNVLTGLVRRIKPELSSANVAVPEDIGKI